MASHDDDSTGELQNLEELLKQPTKDNRCRHCAGNGVVATDSNVVKCPRCNGTKLEPKQ